jgi:hypothetical protein
MPPPIMPPTAMAKVAFHPSFAVLTSRPRASVRSGRGPCRGRRHRLR